MSRANLLQAMVALTLVMPLMVGCGAPAAAPTPTPRKATLTSTPASAPTPTLEPQAQVLLAWHEAWSNKNIDAFMALVADDAVLDRGPYGVITGTEKIREVAISEMKEGLKAQVGQFKVEGNKVTYYYEVFSGGKRVGQGRGVAIVENGKIKSDLPE